MDSGVKPVSGTTAATTNVSLCMRALERAMHRPIHLPGMVGFYGPSGYGKSMAAAFAAIQHKAYYIECRDNWTRKSFLEKLLVEMRVNTKATRVSDLADVAAEQLSLAQLKAPRPLIIDEADKPVQRGYIEMIRDIYEGSGGVPILLIGEEQLEISLRRHERVHNRMLDWIAAQPATMDDMRKLLALHYPKLQVADDLLIRIHEATGGVTRRIVVNLANVSEVSAVEGWRYADPITLAKWGNRQLFVGEARRPK